MQAIPSSPSSILTRAHTGQVELQSECVVVELHMTSSKCSMSVKWTTLAAWPRPLPVAYPAEMDGSGAMV